MNGNPNQNRLEPGACMRFTICGMAWGIVLCAFLSLYFTTNIYVLNSNQKSIECLCLPIAIAGSIGLTAGLVLDSRIRDEETRGRLLRDGWRYFAGAFFLLAFSNGFWLPAAQ